jgi:DHA2 family multidrug resistance protein
MKRAGGAAGDHSASGDHNPWLIAVVVSIATFMQVLDTSIANVSLRHIAGGLGATYPEATWIVTSYLVASAVVLPVSGWLANVIGRKRFYMTSVALFSVSSLLCGLAPNLGLLIFFRVLQGLGGGGLAPSEQSILADTFPGAKRGQAFALYGVTVVVAPTIGPTLGGYITETFSWHWIFLINVPIGILSLALTGSLVVEPPANQAERQKLLQRGVRIDMVGLVLVALGLGCLEVVIDRGQEAGWLSSPFVASFAAVSLISLVALVPWELTRSEPIVDLRLFANRQFALCAIAVTVTGALIFSTIQLLPQLLQTVMNYTATQAGLAMTPGGLAALIELPITAFLMRKVQPRWIVAFGMLTEAVAMWSMTDFNTAMSFSHVAWARVIQSFGLAFLFVPITTAAYGTLKPEQTNQASALMNVGRNVGGSLGIAGAQALVAVASLHHGASLTAQIDPGSTALQTMAADISRRLGQPAEGPASLSPSTLAVVLHGIHRQAEMLAYIDVFKVLAVVAFLGISVALLLRRIDLTSGGGESGD